MNLKKQHRKVVVSCGVIACVTLGITNVMADEKSISANNGRAGVIGAVSNALEISQIEVENNELATMTLNTASEEEYLLAKIAMAEAEGEDVEGKALVIRVVLNRVESELFPNSVEEVIFQEHQFSPVSDGRWYEVEPTSECWDALKMVQNGWDESQGSLFFESEGQSKWHKENLQFLFKHGNHNFYTVRGLEK